MSKRKKIRADVKRAVSATGLCQKCGVMQGEYHHIQTVFDGGSDEAENLALLCTLCHREWHMLAEGKIPFGRWVVFPPAIAIVHALAMEEAEDTISEMSIAEFMYMLKDALRMTREQIAVA